MKKYIILFIVFFHHLSCTSQDYVIVNNKAYKSTFSISKKYPVVVEWWLTRKMITCDIEYDRTDDFKPDPHLKMYTNLDKDYKGSGYDRGHLFPAQYAECNLDIMKESFYFSNIIPQTPQLNRGDWKMVEELTKLEAKQYDSVYVWAGGIGELKKIGSVSVPKQCWKVIYVKKTKEFFAYLHENNSSKANGINDNNVNLQTIEKITGLKFQMK